MCKVINKMAPDCTQSLFQLRETQYELRGMCLFTKTKSKTNRKQRCLSVIGVHLWHSFETVVKMCNTLNRFKKSPQKKMHNKHKSEECNAATERDQNPICSHSHEPK